jgi:ribosomal protein L44E|tara:strand:+ start:15571 stop:15843 length:273 start_codon:yes stop_codon:yes gene_type:complete
MISIREMAEGWINYVRDKQPDGLSDEMREMSIERAKICNACPSLLLRETKIMKKTIFKFRCAECGCAFPMMTYSKRKKCPKGKWPDDTGS